MRFRRILVPMDLSPSGAGAIRAGAEVAHRLRAALTLLWVVSEERLEAQGCEGGPARPADLICEELKREVLTRFVRVVRPELRQEMRVEPLVRIGVPSEEILETAERTGADVIVLSMPGRASLDRMLRRRVFERVIRQATCPVLAVPRPTARSSRRAAS
ncbi:MAG TPA: universal stress protein [Candidatus Sulfotelmatobacter sp.]|nr:universal stress protein [Candidatus Sulfotelmatobacter sp.]